MFRHLFRGEADLGRQPEVDFSDGVFGHREHHVHGALGIDLEHLLAAGDLLEGIDELAGDDPVEGGDQHRLLQIPARQVELRAGVGHLVGGAVAGGEGLIEGRLGHPFLLVQGLLADELGLLLGELRLGPAHFGLGPLDVELERLVVEGRQHLALLDPVADVDVHLPGVAGDLEADARGVHGLDHAGEAAHLPGAALGDGDGLDRPDVLHHLRLLFFAGR